MNKWNMWTKIGAGLILSAALVMGGPQILKLQTAMIDMAEYSNKQPIPDNLEIKKSGFGFQEESEKIVKTYSSKPEVGPGLMLLGGAKLTMLANQTASQMLSVVIETRKGSLIVIDGGTPGDASHLLDTIRAKGGKVQAWLITHPHSDHVGALTEIINNPDNRISIENIYYSFADISWYKTNEAYRADTVEKLMRSFESVPNEGLHGNITKGQEIKVDDVKITVMNQPYLFSNNAINNSSVAYKLDINGKKLVFLGDMGVEAGERFLAENSQQDLKCDILQMSHHGQNGVTQPLYQAMSPEICLWPTPDWLWNNDNGGGAGSGSWATAETRQWMEHLGVTANYCIKDGDQILK